MGRLGFSLSVAVLMTFTLASTGAVGPVTRASALPHEPAFRSDAAAARAREAYGGLPLSFEGNRGQTDPTVRFLARGGGYTLFLTPTETVLTVDHGGESAAVVRLSLVGANRAPRISGQGDLPGPTHYLIGDDPRQWRRGVPRYESVRYEEIYPGIDLIYYGNQNRLEYDFVVGANADPDVIRLEFAGASGCSVDERGDLVLDLDGGALVQRKPVIYQEVGGVRREIEGAYRIDDRSRVSFEIGAYDESRPLVIDPVLDYATYLGGSGGNAGDIGFGITVDDAGSAYVIGATNSLDFPVTTGGFQPVNGGGSNPRDVFVTKLNADGTGLVFSTYLGGSGTDGGGTIAVDPTGAVYISGGTTSPDFPTTEGAFQRTLAGTMDAFVAKLSADGTTLVFSTYLGGSGQDAGGALARGADGSVYLSGWTTSADFPISKQALQPEPAGMADAYVAKLNESGSALTHSTYLGGSSNDIVTGIDLGVDGSVYVTGSTASADFPTTEGALQPDYAGSRDAFVAKLNGSVKRILYSTYLGGGRLDQARRIAVDASGSAHVTGDTQSADFPTTPDAYQPTQPPPDQWIGDAFVAKLAARGERLIYSTYLGGGNTDLGRGIALDAAGCVYVTGTTTSFDFPTTADALQSTNASHCSGSGCADVFLTKLCEPDGALAFSTYFGGTREDSVNGIALGVEGSVYLTGETNSFDLPTTPGAAQPSNAGGSIASDAFVARIEMGAGGGGAGNLPTAERESRCGVTGTLAEGPLARRRCP